MTRRAAVAVIVAIAFAIVAKPLLTSEVFTFRDHASYFQPLRFFTAVQLQHHHLPLWNPYNASGEPWLANPQTGVFYAPTWLFVFLPFPAAYSLFLFLHLALLGIGALVLFNRRVSVDAALVGAIALMVSGPALSLLDVTNNFTTFAWLPLVIWCGVARAGVSVSALAIAMSFLAGEPFFAAIGALMFAILRRDDIRGVVVTALAAFGLTAVQLFPFLEMLHDSDRAATIPREQVFRDSMPLLDWLRIAVPPHLDLYAYDTHLGQHFIPIIYCGMATVLLALIGTIARPLAARRFPLALLLFAIVVAAGSHLPPVEWLFAHLPLTLFRYPARVVPLGALAIAALASLGWERLRLRTFFCALAVAVVGVDGLSHALPLLHSGTFNPHPVPQPGWVGREKKFVRLPGMSWLDRTAWIDGYLNLYDLRFDAWTAAPVSTQRYTELYEASILAARIGELNRMSVGFLVGARALPPAFPLVAHARGVNVYRNPYAWPMAYWRGDDGSVLSANFFSTGASFARMEVDAPRPGIAVITQQDAPGWKAVVDGSNAAATTRAGGVWRGVRVGAGHHVIEWRYEPLSFRLGWISTLLTMALLVFSRSFVKRR